MADDFKSWTQQFTALDEETNFNAFETEKLENALDKLKSVTCLIGPTGAGKKAFIEKYFIERVVQRNIGLPIMMGSRSENGHFEIKTKHSPTGWQNTGNTIMNYLYTAVYDSSISLPGLSLAPFSKLIPLKWNNPLVLIFTDLGIDSQYDHRIFQLIKEHQRDNYIKFILTSSISLKNRIDPFMKVNQKNKIAQVDSVEFKFPVITLNFLDTDTDNGCDAKEVREHILHELKKLSLDSKLDKERILALTHGAYGAINELFQLSPTTLPSSESFHSLIMHEFHIQYINERQPSQNNRDKEITQLLEYLDDYIHLIPNDITESNLAQFPQMNMSTLLNVADAIDILQKDSYLLNKNSSVNAYRLNPLFQEPFSSAIDHLKNDIKFATLKQLSEYIKQRTPWAYDIRSRIAGILKSPNETVFSLLAMTYESAINGGQTSSSRLSSDLKQRYTDMLKIVSLTKKVKSPHATKRDRDSLKKTITRINKSHEKVSELAMVPILITSIEAAKALRDMPLTKEFLGQGLEIYRFLVKSGEKDLQLKLGFSVAPELVNYDFKNGEELGRNIFSDMNSIIKDYHLRWNSTYQKELRVMYTIRHGVLTTSDQQFNDLKDAYQQLREDSPSMQNTVEQQYVLTNLIGCALSVNSLDLNKQDLVKSIKNLNSLVSNSKDSSNFKAINNIFLGKYFLKEIDAQKYMAELRSRCYLNHTEQDIIQDIQIPSSHSIIALNYGNLLILSSKFKQAKELFRNVRNHHTDDSFYTFYCKYGITICNLCLRPNVEATTTFLENLSDKIPEMFRGHKMEQVLQGQLNQVIDYLMDNDTFDKEAFLRLLQIGFDKDLDDKPLIAQTGLMFSDLQIWD